MATTEEVQAQLEKFLKENPASPEKETGQIQPCPDPLGSDGSDFRGLIKAKDKSHIISKTFRFHSLEDLWQRIKRLLG